MATRRRTAAAKEETVTLEPKSKRARPSYTNDDDDDDAPSTKIQKSPIVEHPASQEDEDQTGADMDAQNDQEDQDQQGVTVANVDDDDDEGDSVLAKSGSSEAQNQTKKAIDVAKAPDAAKTETKPDETSTDDSSKKQESTDVVEKLFDPNDILRKTFNLFQKNKFVFFEHWDVDNDVYCHEYQRKKTAQNNKIITMILKSNKIDKWCGMNNKDQNWNIGTITPFMPVGLRTGCYPFGGWMDVVREDGEITGWMPGLDLRPSDPKNPDSAYTSNVNPHGHRRKIALSDRRIKWDEGDKKTMDFDAMNKASMDYMEFRKKLEDRLIMGTAAASRDELVAKWRRIAEGQEAETITPAPTSAPAPDAGAPKSNAFSKSKKRKAEDEGDKKDNPPMRFYPNEAQKACPLNMTKDQPTVKLSLAERKEWEKKSGTEHYAKLVKQVDNMDKEKKDSWDQGIAVQLMQDPSGGRSLFSSSVYEFDPAKSTKKTKKKAEIPGGTFTFGKAETKKADAPKAGEEKADVASIEHKEFEELEKKGEDFKNADGKVRTVSFTRPLFMNMTRVEEDNKPKPSEKYLANKILNGWWNKGRGHYLDPLPMYVFGPGNKLVLVPFMEEELQPSDLIAIAYEETPYYDYSAFRLNGKPVFLILYRKNPNPRKYYEPGVVGQLKIADDMVLHGATIVRGTNLLTHVPDENKLVGKDKKPIVDRGTSGFDHMFPSQEKLDAIMASAIGGASAPPADSTASGGDNTKSEASANANANTGAKK